jgi:hypothetical protein
MPFLPLKRRNFIMEERRMVKLGRLKRGFAVLLAVLMTFTLLPGHMKTISAAGGTKTTLDISYGTITIGNGTVDGYDSSGNHITTPNSNGYIITGSSVHTGSDVHVSVTGGTHNIVLQDLQLYNNYSVQSSAFSVASGATANITLVGKNALYAYGCGMLVPNGATVYIASFPFLFA